MSKDKDYEYLAERQKLEEQSDGRKVVLEGIFATRENAGDTWSYARRIYPGATLQGCTDPETGQRGFKVLIYQPILN